MASRCYFVLIWASFWQCGFSSRTASASGPSGAVVAVAAPQEAAVTAHGQADRKREHSIPAHAKIVPQGSFKKLAASLRFPTTPKKPAVALRFPATSRKPAADARFPASKMLVAAVRSPSTSMTPVATVRSPAVARVAGSTIRGTALRVAGGAHLRGARNDTTAAVPARVQSAGSQDDVANLQRQLASLRSDKQALAKSLELALHSNREYSLQREIEHWHTVAQNAENEVRAKRDEVQKHEMLVSKQMDKLQKTVDDVEQEIAHLRDAVKAGTAENRLFRAKLSAAKRDLDVERRELLEERNKSRALELKIQAFQGAEEQVPAIEKEDAKIRKAADFFPLQSPHIDSDRAHVISKIMIVEGNAKANSSKWQKEIRHSEPLRRAMEAKQNDTMALRSKVAEMRRKMAEPEVEKAPKHGQNPTLDDEVDTAQVLVQDDGLAAQALQTMWLEEKRLEDNKESSEGSLRHARRLTDLKAHLGKLTESWAAAPQAHSEDDAAVVKHIDLTADLKKLQKVVPT
eukprot:TRINITY_DN19474_c0_g1_i1.p1 TRINITY_DN19474_c0_g1~~TRINITY_DN19474_c0_g1_i1.p1  ORF type:complete len:572 (-),score=122.02 TRINITY_DN19474_c0_g1_i1:112-1662(-)